MKDINFLINHLKTSLKNFKINIYEDKNIIYLLIEKYNLKEIIKFLKKQNENKNKKGNEYVFDIQKEIWIKVFIKKEKK